MSRRHLLAASAAALAMMANDARAQALEEIVVTAQRRAESVQDVPLSITAFSGAALERSGINDTFELQFNTPGLVLSTNKSQGQPYIRGIGTDILTVGTDSSVATNVDGVYQTRNNASIQEFFDVERVEVVKGPQGTLYGRNATGGAINLVTRRPTTEGVEGYVDFSFGNFDALRAEAAINMPVSDQVALRVAAVAHQRDGFSEDILNDRDLDDADIFGARLSLLARFNERFEAELRGYLTRETSARALAGKPNYNSFSPAINVFGAEFIADEREVQLNHPNENEITDDQIHLELRYDAGPVQVKSLTSWDNRTLEEIVDIDSTEVDFAWDTDDQEAETWIQEFQVLSQDDGPLQWVLGAYYLSENADQRFIVYVPPIGGIIDPVAEIETEAWALFGEGSYQLTESWSVTAGLRYSQEEKTQSLVTTLTDPVGGLGTPGGVFTTVQGGNETWDALTPRFGIEYEPNDTLLLYGFVSRGFKSGGFNTAGAGEMFDPEFIWSYEAGVKSNWADGRVQVNAAAFYYDYSDLQVNRFEPQTGGAVSTVTNAASAELYGLDLEVLARPTDALDLDWRVSLLQAEYDEFLTSNPDAADPNALLDLGGNTLPRAPEFASTLGLGYAVPIDRFELRVRGEWSYQSEVFFDQFNAPLVSQEGYHLFNAYADLVGEDDRWNVGLYGRNLTDETYLTTVIRSTSFIGTLNFYGPPRTFGIRARYNF